MPRPPMPGARWIRPNTLYLELESGRVIIELAPQFAPEHVANIRTMAHEHFWDGLSIYRSQDNFVVQFGDPDGDDPAKARSLGTAKKKLPAEFHRASAGLEFEPPVRRRRLGAAGGASSTASGRT